MTEFIDYLQSYVQLNDQEVSHLVEVLVERTYLKGQYIVQEGDICNTQNYILSGMVRTYYLDRSGTEYIIAFGQEHWWAGDLGSFITQTPADFNVQCLENTTVVQIPKDQLEDLYLKIPKIERFFRLIIQSAYVSAQKRIVRNFSLSAKERYLLFVAEYPTIVQRVPQYMIASYLGITKEFLSNLRSQIAKEQRS